VSVLDEKIMRRVAGYHDIRMDGMTDIVVRARGASVMDVGCNRGLVGFEFANNGATTVHGCDNFEDGIHTARQLFVDLRNVESQFEVVDLTKGPSAFKPFGEKTEWDIVLLLATYHKLKRVMEPVNLSELVTFLGRRTRRYLAWRGTSDKPTENEQEMSRINRDLESVGMRKVHTSYLSQNLGVCAVWEKGRSPW
jgi:SAM-dependent methyltransferase